MGRGGRGRGQSGSSILGEGMHPTSPPIGLLLLSVEPSNVPLSESVGGQLGLVASNLQPVPSKCLR